MRARGGRGPRFAPPRVPAPQLRARPLQSPCACSGGRPLGTAPHLLFQNPYPSSAKDPRAAVPTQSLPPAGVQPFYPSSPFLGPSPHRRFHQALPSPTLPSRPFLRPLPSTSFSAPSSNPSPHRPPLPSIPFLGPAPSSAPLLTAPSSNSALRPPRPLLPTPPLNAPLLTAASSNPSPPPRPLPHHSFLSPSPRNPSSRHPFLGPSPHRPFLQLRPAPSSNPTSHCPSPHGSFLEPLPFPQTSGRVRPVPSRDPFS